MELVLIVLSTIQLSYLHRTTGNNPEILFETNLQRNAEVLKGNIAVFYIPHTFKSVVTIGKNFRYSSTSYAPLMFKTI